MTAGTSTGRPGWTGLASASATPGVAPLVLVAITTVLLLQATRVFLSYMVFIIDQSERAQLGVTAGAVYLAIGFGAALPMLGAARRSVVILTAGMVAARIALQFWTMPEARMWLAAAVIVLSGWMLPFLLAWSRSTAAYGVGLGLALDLVFRIGRESIDLPFIPSPTAHLLTLALGLLAVISALALRRDGPGTLHGGLATGALALGPALALHHLALGNLGAVQVHTGAGLNAGAWLLSAGVLLGLAIDLLLTGEVTSADNENRARRYVLPVLSVIGALGLLVFWQDRAGLAEVGVVVGSAATIALIVAALRGRPGTASVRSLSLWLTLGMVIQAIVLFVYFSATGLPLLIVLVYALIAAIGLPSAWHRPANQQRSTQIASAGLAAVAAMLLLTTLVATRRTDDPEATAALPAEFTVMTYNIQSGFSRDNHWDLEETARVIEAAKPDVVFLQEVGRGWPILSGVDQASWLSRRLDMQLVWGPASQDELWGNAILTRAPILATEAIKYDTTENLKRGAVRAVVESASGPVTLIATHLDNPGDAASARQAQVAQLLTFWNNASPAVIGGDFNADPDSAAITAIVSAGMIDSGASLGPAATTSENNHRIDYLLVTPDLAVTGAEIPDTWASDHRPFVARLRSSP